MKLQELIGKGKYGEVRKAKCLQSGELRVIKRIEKIDCTDSVLTEIQLLKKLDHPNIVRLYEVFEDEKTCYLVEELCSGGDLLSYIRKTEKISEKIAASLIKQILSALKCCHDLGIVHRDIKAENVAFSSESPDSPIKLLDFGISKRMPNKQYLTDRAGSAIYIAPEVLEKYSSSPSDIWSIGVLLYILLSKNPPFSGKCQDEILAKVYEGKYNLYGYPWTSISRSCKDFITKCLTLDQFERFTAEEALQHEFIQNIGSSEISLTTSEEIKSILDQMENSPRTGILERAIRCQIAIFQQTNEKINNNVRLFSVLDSDLDCKIGKKDLKKAIKNFQSLKFFSERADTRSSVPLL